MIDYIAQLWDTAFNFEDFSRGERKFAFFQLMMIMIAVFGVCGFVFRIVMRLTGRRQHMSARDRLMAEMADNAPIGATKQELRELAAAELAARRAAVHEVPPIPVSLAPRPDDGRYFMTLRVFAEIKQAEGLVLNQHEKEALELLGLAYDAMGPDGLVFLDTFDGVAPVRSSELANVLERVGLAEFVSPFNQAIALHLKRYQLIQDYVATGMPLEKAKASFSLPSYDPIDAALKLAGGQARLVHVADRYYQAAYPWQETLQKSAVA